jgi:hypothetical protein
VLLSLVISFYLNKILSLTPLYNDDSSDFYFILHQHRLLFSGHLGLHTVPKEAGIVIKNWTMDQQSFEPGGSH